MRILPMVLGCAAMAGCASASSMSNQVASAASAPVPQVMSCVTQQLGTLGYQATTSNAMGPIRAERQNDEPWWLNMIGINDTVDVLDANFAGGQLRVSAFSQVLRGSDRDAAAPSEEAIVDANTIVEACT